MAGLDKSDYYGERDLSCKTDSVKENQSKNGIKASVEQKFPTSASDGFPSNEHDRLLSQAATPDAEKTLLLNATADSLQTDNVSEAKHPRDRFGAVYIIIMIHGIGVLMSWNMFITAQNYFIEYKLSRKGEPKPEYAKNFMSYLGVCSQVPNLLFNLLNLFVQVGGSLTIRVAVSIVVVGIVFVLTVILAVVDTSEWPFAFFIITMISVIILNGANGVYQNSIYGIAADLPRKYSNAVVLGNNISGTFAAIILIISIAASPNLRTAAVYYFITALAVLVVCFDSYFVLPLCRFYRHYRDLAAAQKLQTQKPTSTRRHWTKKNDNRNCCRRICERLGESLKPYRDVFKKAWIHMLSVFLLFFVTLTIFPAIQADIEPLSKDFPIPTKYFTPVTCFLFFNMFAMIGNIVAHWLHFPTRRLLWIFVLLRLLMIPFFMFCNYRPKLRTFDVYISNDYAYIAMGILMAFTSGHFSSLAMMYAPDSVEPERAGIAGMMSAFFLILGIVAGLNHTFFVAYIIENLGPLTPNSTVITT